MHAGALASGKSRAGFAFRAGCSAAVFRFPSAAAVGGAGDFQKKEGENAESRLQSVRLKAILCLAYIR